MNIALIGYGRMGQEIEKKAFRLGHTITVRIDIENITDLNPGKLSGSDVAIEFTHPDAAPGNIIKCFEAGIPVVSGTTGWLERMPKVKDVLKKYSGTLFYASNFSVGVNLLFAVNSMVAKAMDRIDGYVPSISEVHHTGKVDAPSGTALSLAGGISEFTDWHDWEVVEKSSGESGESRDELKSDLWSGNTNEDRSADGRESGVTEDNRMKVFEIISERKGEIAGIHVVKWLSENDIISLKHEAFSRDGFVSGALLAAEYATKHSGLLTMQQLLGF